MQFEVLYQELAGGVEVIRALVAGVAAEEARPRPISKLYQSESQVILS